MKVCEFTPLPRLARIIGVSTFTRTITARALPDAFSIGKMKIVVSDAVHDDDVEIRQPLDVLRPRLVVAGVNAARQQGPHLITRQIAHDVGRPRVVRMQRDANLEWHSGFWRLRMSRCGKQQAQAKKRCRQRRATEATHRARAEGVSRANTDAHARRFDSSGHREMPFLCASSASLRLCVSKSPRLRASVSRQRSLWRGPFRPHQPVCPSIVLRQPQRGEAAAALFLGHIPNRHVQRGAICKPLLRLVIGSGIGRHPWLRFEDDQHPGRAAMDQTAHPGNWSPSPGALMSTCTRSSASDRARTAGSPGPRAPRRWASGRSAHGYARLRGDLPAAPGIRAARSAERPGSAADTGAGRIAIGRIGDSLIVRQTTAGSCTRRRLTRLPTPP